MFKLRQTWAPFFTNLSLYNLDTRTHDIDPAWPITARVPDPPPFAQNIHLNPNFLQRVGHFEGKHDFYRMILESIIPRYFC